MNLKNLKFNFDFFNNTLFKKVILKYKIILEIILVIHCKKKLTNKKYRIDKQQLFLKNLNVINFNCIHFFKTNLYLYGMKKNLIIQFKFINLKIFIILIFQKRKDLNKLYFLKRLININFQK